jgi:hypothetical protein
MMSMTTILQVCDSSPNAIQFSILRHEPCIHRAQDTFEQCVGRAIMSDRIRAQYLALERSEPLL